MNGAAVEAARDHQQRQREEQMEEARLRGDWGEYRLLNGGHINRLAVLLSLLGDGHLDDPAAYWPWVRRAWIGTLEVHRALRTWRRLFQAPRPGRAQHLMSDHERSHLADVPDPVTVYRGFSHPGGRRGIAWTLDEIIAMCFADRTRPFHGGAYMAMVTIPRDRIVALFDEEPDEDEDRVSEHEVIVPDLRGYRPQVVTLDARIAALVDNPLTTGTGNRSGIRKTAP